MDYLDSQHSCLSCERYIQHFGLWGPMAEVFCQDTQEHDTCRIVDLREGCPNWQSDGIEVDWEGESMN